MGFDPSDIIETPLRFLMLYPCESWVSDAVLCMALPLNVLLEYENNLAAKEHPIDFTGNLATNLGKQLENAPLVQGLTAGQVEPWLNRLQFDLIYSF